MKKTTTSIAALGLAAALTLSGCGLFEPKPEEVLGKAFDKEDEFKQRRVEMRTTASEEQLRDGVFSDGEEHLSDADRAARDRMISHLRETTVITDVRSTNDQAVSTLTGTQDMDWAMEVKVGDSMLVQMMETGDFDVFTRMDVPTMLSMSGEEVPSLAEIQQQLDQIPVGMDWMRGLVKGDWLGFEGSLAEEMKKQVEEQSGVNAEDSLTPEEQSRLQDSMLEHSELEKVDGEGDRYRMRLRVKEFVEANKELVGKHLAAQETAEGEDPMTVDELISRLNDGTMEFVYTVEDEKIRRVETDPLQFADVMEPAADATEEERRDHQKMRDAEFPMTMDYSEDVRDFTAPEGAVRLTEQDLAMLAMMGGSLTA